MTCLRYRIKEIESRIKQNYSIQELTQEIEIIKENLREFGDSRYLPCCLIFREGYIKCEYLGFLPKEIFSAVCKKCKEDIKSRIEELEKLIRGRC